MHNPGLIVNGLLVSEMSESDLALFTKCAQTHEEFVVAFKKLLVHTYMHTCLTWEQKHLNKT